jgi:hypothetical protein
MPGPTCRSTRSLQLRLLAFQKFNLTEQELIFCRDFSKQPNPASVALPMRNLILMMLRSLLTSLRTQAAMQTQIIALHHQVIVLANPKDQATCSPSGGSVAVGLALRLWSGGRSALIIVKPETVLSWHWKGFRWYWT